MSTTEIVFDLSISAEEYLGYYQGSVSSILVKTRNGRTVRFPASRLRAFVDDSGVHGCFRMRYDRNNKLISLERISR